MIKRKIQVYAKPKGDLSVDAQKSGTQNEDY